MEKIYLPSHIEGLTGTGWDIINNILYCGYEDYGNTYLLNDKYSIPPTGYVGYWEF